MIFPREIQDLHSQITEYLQYAKFDNTHECFEHEIKTKIVTKKLLDKKINLMDDDTPELFRMLKGVSKKSKKEREQLRNFNKLQDEYLDLLAGSRQIFKLSLSLIDICEENIDVLKSATNKSTIGRIRDQLVRYHRLILPESKQKLDKAPSQKKLQKMTNKLERLVEQGNNYQEQVKFMREVRATGLSIIPKEREQWIDDMIDINFLQISRKEDDNLVVDTMLNQPKASLQTINYGILSMIASTHEGCEYLLKYKKFLPRVWKVMKTSVNDTVLQRFNIAILQKLSVLEQGAVFLFENKFCDWALDYLEEMDPAKEHSFMPIYILSTIYNILLADANQADILLDVTRYSRILKRLLKLIKMDLPGACYTAILEIVKGFNRYNARWVDFEIEAKVNVTLKEYLDGFEDMFKDRKMVESMKNKISDLMLLISGEEKPIGYFQNGFPQEEDEKDQSKQSEKKKKKSKKSKKDKKSKSKKKSSKKKRSKSDSSDSSDNESDTDSYFKKYFDKKFIKLYRGKKIRKGFLGAVETNQVINFEVFKDELEMEVFN